VNQWNFLRCSVPLCRSSPPLSFFIFLILLASSFPCCTAWRNGCKLVRIAVQEVLDAAVVGGFEVSVLGASESGVLITRLEENDYDDRPEIRDWVAPYVKKKWTVTAFKYAADVDQSHAPLTRASVCLSVRNRRAFFPYRVPRDIRVNPRDGSLLRLYFSASGVERDRESSGGALPNRPCSVRTSFDPARPH